MDQEGDDEHDFWAALESLGMGVPDEVKEAVRARLRDGGFDIEELAAEFLGIPKDQIRIRSEIRAQKNRSRFSVLDNDP